MYLFFYILNNVFFIFSILFFVFIFKSTYFILLKLKFDGEGFCACHYPPSRGLDFKILSFLVWWLVVSNWKM